MRFEMIPVCEENLKGIDKTKRYFVTGAPGAMETDFTQGTTWVGSELHLWKYFCPEPIEPVLKQPDEAEIKYKKARLDLLETEIRLWESVCDALGIKPKHPAYSSKIQERDELRRELQ